MAGDVCLVTSWRMKDTRAGIVENKRMFDVYQSTSQSTRLTWNALSWVKVNKRRENTIGDRSPDIFYTEEAGERNRRIRRGGMRKNCTLKKNRKVAAPKTRTMKQTRHTTPQCQEKSSTLYWRGWHGFGWSGGFSSGKTIVRFKQSRRQKYSTRELGWWRRKRRSLGVDTLN